MEYLQGRLSQPLRQRLWSHEKPVEQQSFQVFGTTQSGMENV